jgi:hypothetical protein
MGLRLGLAKQNIEVGKVEEFAGGGSYGKNIPYVFGSRVVEGMPLWFAPIEERVTKKSKKKGQILGIGGTKVTTTTYDYYASFAMWFGEGPATKLVRLWMDDLLVFDGAEVDLTDPDIAPFTVFQTRFGRRQIVNEQFKIQQENRIPYTVYLGSEDQDQDPTIVATEGAANTPAYRGMCYIVFNRVKLEQFDNKIPKVRAEFIFDVGGSDISISETTLAVEVNDRAQLQIDYKRGLIYTMNDGVNEVSLVTLGLDGTLIRSVTYPDSLDEGSVVIDMEFNQHYSRRGTGGIRHNSFTGAAEYTDHTNTKPLTGRFGGTMLYASPGSTTRFLFTSGRTSSSIHRDIASHNIEVGQIANISVSTTGGMTSYVTPTAPNDARFGFAYYITGGVLSMVRCDGANGTFKSDYATMLPAAFNLDSFDVSSAAKIGWDDGNDRVVGFVAGIKNSVSVVRIFAWSEATGLAWVTEVPFGLFSTEEYNMTFPRLNGGRWAWTNGSQICAVELTDGKITTQYDGVNNGYVGISGTTLSQAYDDSTNKLYMLQRNAAAPDDLQVIQLFLGEQTGSSLSSIVRKVASECGLVEGYDFDVSAIDDIPVPGYLISKTDEGKKHLDPLLEFFQINVVERDHRIYFEERQTVSLDTLTTDDMLSGSKGQVFKRDRQEESALPQTYEVEYVDRIRDYEKGIQRASRVKFPIPTTASTNTENFAIDIALNPSDAKQQVEKLMYASWIERNAYEFGLPQRWLAFTPGDLVTFVQPSGYTSDIMFDRLAIGADFTMKANTVEQSTGMYVSFATSTTGSWNDPPMYLSAPSEPFLLDIPFLTDDDVPTTDNLSIGYWAGSDYGAETNSWPGAFIHRSYDNLIYTQLDARVNRSNWGILTSALAAPDSPWVTDNTNVVSVFMNSGYLAASEYTISKDDMLTGLYNRAVICHADGTFELIYFSEVVEVSDRALELHSLLRGRRGTDTNLVAAAGDRIVFLSDGLYDDDISTYGIFAQPIAQTLADDQFYKVVTRGLLVSETLAETTKYTCADLKPYAPDHVTAFLDTIGDIVINWERRTRIGGEMEDLIDVPLSEETEAYEIDIYNVAGTTVLRTLTSTVSQVDYLAANVLTDQLTATPATLKVGVYQMSATVGRGFGRIITVEVG